MPGEEDMKPTRQTRSGYRRPLVAVAAAGLLSAIAAVYVIGSPGGNTSAGKSCQASLAAASAAKPFARGDVAAFLPAQKPLDLRSLKFKGPNGEDVSIAQFTGKTVLLNLWATWCAPCRKEMPALDRLAQARNGDDFAVVTVNLDRGGPEKPKAFLDEIGVASLTYYSDASNAVFQDLRSKARATGLPATILAGPDGCEIGTMYGPAEWDHEDALQLIDAARAKAPGQTTGQSTGQTAG